MHRGHCSWLSSSHLGEGSSRLSEILQPERGAGRGYFDILLFLYFWMVGTCLIKIVILKAWGEWLCMNDMVHGLKMVDLVWSWYVILYGMVGWQSGMVLIWNTILYSWFGKEELVRIQHWIWMRMGYKGCHEIMYMINITNWLSMIGLWPMRNSMSL